MNQSSYLWIVTYYFYRIVFSGYFFVLEGVKYAELESIPMSSWESFAGDLADLLFKEERRSGKEIGLTYEQDDSLSMRLAGIGDSKLIFTSAERVIQTAKEKKESGINITEGRLIYYFYFGWFLQVIKELDNIVKTIGHTSSNSDFYHAYYKPIADELKTGLRFNLNSIEYQENISELELAQLKLEIRTLAAELAADWKDTVYSTVDGLLKGDIDF